MTYILIGIVMAFYGWIAYSAAHDDNKRHRIHIPKNTTINVDIEK